MKWFAAALVIGAAVRIAALPLAGTGDVAIFKGWSYVAAARGAARLYDWAAAPQDRSLRQFEGVNAQGDYPPLALYELEVVGRLYRRAAGGHFPDNPALTASIKALPLLADVGIACLLFVATRQAIGVGGARWAALAYWLNPALILCTNVLGYVDTLFMLPTLGALVAGLAGRPTVAGALMAAAVLTKPQALVLAPAVALVIWNLSERGRGSRYVSALAGAAVVSVAILVPVIAAGSARNMALAVGSVIVGTDMLSAGAFNLWWLVGHLLRMIHEVPATGFTAAIRMQADIVPLVAIIDVALPTARILGSTLALAAIGWGLWTSRRARDLWLVAAAGAFAVHAYAALATQVHENHLLAALPLLTIAAAARRQFLPVLVAVSAIFALNLNLLYGFGEDIGHALPRTATGVDMTVLIAAANCAALVWHGSVLRRACLRPRASQESEPGSA